MWKISHFIHCHSQSMFRTFALSEKKREFIGNANLLASISLLFNQGLSIDQRKIYYRVQTYETKCKNQCDVKRKFDTNRPTLFRYYIKLKWNRKSNISKPWSFDLGLISARFFDVLNKTRTSACSNINQSIPAQQLTHLYFTAH